MFASILLWLFCCLNKVEIRFLGCNLLLRWNPVRDLILVEIRSMRIFKRAVRYAIFYFVLNGTFNALGNTFFYQYYVPNATYLRLGFNYSTNILSLTGQFISGGILFSTNIMSLTGQFTTLFITTTDFFSNSLIIKQIK